VKYYKGDKTLGNYHNQETAKFKETLPISLVNKTTAASYLVS